MRQVLTDCFPRLQHSQHLLLGERHLDRLLELGEVETSPAVCDHRPRRPARTSLHNVAAIQRFVYLIKRATNCQAHCCIDVVVAAAAAAAAARVTMKVVKRIEWQ